MNSFVVSLVTIQSGLSAENKLLQVVEAESLILGVRDLQRHWQDWRSIRAAILLQISRSLQHDKPQIRKLQLWPQLQLPFIPTNPMTRQDPGPLTQTLPTLACHDPACQQQLLKMACVSFLPDLSLSTPNWQNKIYIYESGTCSFYSFLFYVCF